MSEKVARIMINSINDVEKSKVKEELRNYGKQIKNALLSGIAMSVAVLITWLLLSKTEKNVGMAMLVVTAALAVFDSLIFIMLKNVNKKPPITATAILAILNTVIFLSVTIYVLAPTQLFYPHFDDQSYAELKTRSGTEELTVKTENGNISGWMLHNAENPAPLVLYFCGNGENAATRILKIMDNGSLGTFAGYNVAIFDYPGYGKTDGSPSEETLKNFGLAVFDALAQREDVDQIIVFGYSIGTGVADYVASKRDVAGLILMAPYSDGYDLYNGFVNIFHGPLRILVAFRMESIQFAKTVSVKPLILASKTDEMVNYNSSVQLSHVFPSGCALITLENMGHNEFWGSTAVLKHIEEYLAEVNS